MTIDSAGIIDLNTHLNICHLSSITIRNGDSFESMDVREEKINRKGGGDPLSLWVHETHNGKSLFFYVFNLLLLLCVVLRTSQSM